MVIIDTSSIELRVSLSGRHTSSIPETCLSELAEPSTTSPITACMSDDSHESSTLIAGARLSVIFLANATDGLRKMYF